MTEIRITALRRRFGAFAALNGIDLSIGDREFLALLGPSGSGKTTLLRILGGLDFADAGEVLFDGEDISVLPARERRVGFVFQHYALFRHMTAAANVGFGLRVLPRAQRPSRREIAERARSLLALVQIEDLGERYPDQLSGGQRQRVALARALAIDPRVLLLDEPFGALDAKVRKELRRWLRDLHERTGVTSVFVTHDQAEALELADRVAVLNRGRIEQVDTPQAIFDRPATPFVHEFLGDATRLAVTVRAGVASFDELDLPHIRADVPDGAAIALVRAHDIAVQPAQARGDANGTVVAVRSLAGRVEVAVEVSGSVLIADLGRDPVAALRLSPGQACAVRIRAAGLYPAGRSSSVPPQPVLAA